MDQETNQFFHKPDSLFASLMRFRKALFIISLSAAIISAIVSLILPKKYKATTTVFTSLTNNTSRSLLDPIYDSKDYVAFGDDKNCEQMMQIFKSADLMYAMAKKFHFYENLGLVKGGVRDWDADYKLKGYYGDNFEFEITEYQSIKITVYDVHPENAFTFANAVVHEADSLYRDVVSQRTRGTFLIVKAQYDSSRAVLKRLTTQWIFTANKVC
jgi:capsular polysaccharide biosynthesis protein